MAEERRQRALQLEAVVAEGSPTQNKGERVYRTLSLGTT